MNCPYCGIKMVQCQGFQTCLYCGGVWTSQEQMDTEAQAQKRRADAIDQWIAARL